MGIFGTKKNAVKAPKEAKTKAIKPSSNPVASLDVLSVVLRPRITEKSGIMSQNGVYTFEVTKNANKDTVAKAIRSLYKVTPIKVAIVNTPAKNVFVKGRKGVVSGLKKAIVTVKKGDKIDFV